MPAPRPMVLVLLLVLVALLVLFIVGQSLGGQQPSGSSTSDSSSLKERFLGKAPRVRWPPGAPCSQIQGGKSCPLPIPKGSGLLRAVTITTDGPLVIDFVPASTPDRTITLDMRDKFSDPADLFVDFKGGRLTLKCALPLTSACNVTVR